LAFQDNIHRPTTGDKALHPRRFDNPSGNHPLAVKEAGVIEPAVVTSAAREGQTAEPPATGEQRRLPAVAAKFCHLTNPDAVNTQTGAGEFERLLTPDSELPAAPEELFVATASHATDMLGGEAGHVFGLVACRGLPRQPGGNCHVRNHVDCHFPEGAAGYPPGLIRDSGFVGLAAEGHPPAPQGLNTPEGERASPEYRGLALGVHCRQGLESPCANQHTAVG